MDVASARAFPLTQKKKKKKKLKQQKFEPFTVKERKVVAKF